VDPLPLQHETTPDCGQSISEVKRGLGHFHFLRSLTIRKKNYRTPNQNKASESEMKFKLNLTNALLAFFSADALFLDII
jgi:hypothetical protein